MYIRQQFSDEEIEYVEAEEDPIKPSNASLIIASPVKDETEVRPFNNMRPSQSMLDKKSEDIENSSEEKSDSYDSSDNDSDSSFEREEKDDRTIISKAPIEEFKAYFETNIDDSRPVYEYKITRKSKIKHQNTTPDRVFEKTPEVLASKKNK